MPTTVDHRVQHAHLCVTLVESVRLAHAASDLEVRRSGAQPAEVLVSRRRGGR